MIRQGADNNGKLFKKTNNNCPCSSFQNPHDVISALSSFEKTQILTQWIQGFSSLKNNVGVDFEKSPLLEPYICHGVEKSTRKCKRRVSAAYCVLNAIRDALRMFLDKEPRLTSDAAEEEMNQLANSSKDDLRSYKEAFPSLSSTVGQSKPTVVLKPKQKKNELTVKADGISNFYSSRLGGGINDEAKREAQVKVKRRITPAKITTQESKNAWGNISSLPNSNNIVHSEMLLNTKISSMESTMSRMDKIMRDGEVCFANEAIQGKKAIGFTKGSLTLHSQKSISKMNSLWEKDIPASVPKFSQETETLMNNTVSVYCAIIQSLLAPSVAVELQLMLRLLSVSDKFSPTINRATGQKGQKSLVNLFIDHDSCRQFAVRVLTKLKYLILNIDQEILLKLLRIRVFVELMPELAKEIRRNIELHHTTLLSKGECLPQDGRYYSGLVSGTNTILTLPFQQDRDSRHNYQSRALSSIYNNREKCRDTFLSQLRAFQQMRITMMDPTQIRRASDQIKVSLVRMKSDLLPSNISWFVEFFTELLIQIGLIPMQELDDDIIKNVADNHRLQKLHSRFTSKVAQKNKSTKPLVLTDSNPNSNLSPDQFFTGHQEFFFIFINTVDSHSFNDHLKRRLIHLILTKTSANETKDIELRINELKMLAKFLGMLIFSPNWYIAEMSTADTDIFSLTTPAIPVNRLIEEACNNGKLVLVLPWILSYLWMMYWDKASMKLPYYKDTFFILRSIHKRIMNLVFEDCSQLAKNLFLIGLQLDLFFSDMVGLLEIESREERLSNCLAFNRNQDSLDASVLTFSRQFAVSTSFHFDDLHKLVIEIESNGRLLSPPVTSKKLRPQSLSNATNDLLAGSTSEQFGTLDPFELDKLQDFMLETPIANVFKSQSKLKDKFFHQHKHMNQICEFVVSFSIEHVLSKSWLENHISPIVEEIAVAVVEKAKITNPVDLDWYINTLQKIEKEVLVLVNYNSQYILKDYILRAMDALTPLYVDNRIKDVAIELTIDHTLQKGNVQTMSTIRFKTKRVLDILLDDSNTTLKNGLSKRPSTCHKTVGINVLERIHELAEKLEMSYRSFNIASDKVFCSDDDSHKIRYISNNLQSAQCVVSLRVLVIKLVHAITKIIKLWVKKQNIRRKADGIFFKDVVDFTAVLSFQGLISNECFVLGSLISTPSVLSSLFNLYSDVSWIKEKMIRNALIKRIELIQGFTALLSGHLISQETASMLILLLNDLRKPSSIFKPDIK